MAPTYRLLFFENARARAEVIRMLFAAEKVNYEMVDVPYDKWLAEVREQTPFGYLPVMEIDGKIHGEHIALELYLAELYGYNGNSPKERLIINQLISLFDSEVALEGGRFKAAPEKKEELTKQLHENHFPRFLKYFTDFITEYSNGKDFVLGEKMTVGDLAIFAATTTAVQELPELESRFPEVAALRKKISKVDGLQQYLAAAPKCSI